MRRRSRTCVDTGGFSAVEVAVALSLGASALAIAVPAFVREVHASRFVEATDGLEAIGARAVSFAASRVTGSRETAAPFPRSVALTPAEPARGHPAVDPPGTWDDPAWHDLGFPTSEPGFAFAEGAPHWFAFAFDSSFGKRRGSFLASAHADMDGDGAQSTFELRGHSGGEEPPALDPGMYVEAPLE